MEKESAHRKDLTFFKTKFVNAVYLEHGQKEGPFTGEKDDV